MRQHLYNFFIPHVGNDHRPHALRPRALKWYVAILVGVKLVAAFLLFTAYPDFAKLSSDLREEVARMINASRAKGNLSALIIDPSLERAAALKAQDMLARQYFEHITPDGKMPWEFINKNDYRFQAMGENLAMDFTTGESAHLALMRSDTHRRNILEQRYQHVGIGVATGIFGGRETNILVEFFAEPIAARSPLARAPTVKPQTVKTMPKPAPKTPPSSAVAQAPQPASIEVLPIRFEAEKVAENEAPLPAPVQETPVSFVVPQEGATPAEAVAPPALAPIAPLTQNMLNGTVKAQASELSFLLRMSAWSQRIFYAALVYLVLTLLINVFVKMRIQSATLIAQTLLVILLVGGLSLIDVHTVEALTNAVKIL